MAHFKTITCIFLFERDKLDGRRKKLYLFIYLFIDSDLDRAPSNRIQK